jgi:hypothetical protein
LPVASPLYVLPGDFPIDADPSRLAMQDFACLPRAVSLAVSLFDIVGSIEFVARRQRACRVGVPLVARTRRVGGAWVARG